jgi:hypothetical protein
MQAPLSRTLARAASLAANILCGLDQGLQLPRKASATKVSVRLGTMLRFEHLADFINVSAHAPAGQLECPLDCGTLHLRTWVIR